MYTQFTQWTNVRLHFIIVNNNHLSTVLLLNVIIFHFLLLVIVHLLSCVCPSLWKIIITTILTVVLQTLNNRFIYIFSGNLEYDGQAEHVANINIDSRGQLG